MTLLTNKNFEFLMPSSPSVANVTFLVAMSVLNGTNTSVYYIKWKETEYCLGVIYHKAVQAITRVSTYNEHGNEGISAIVKISLLSLAEAGLSSMHACPGGHMWKSQQEKVQLLPLYRYIAFYL